MANYEELRSDLYDLVDKTIEKLKAMHEETTDQCSEESDE